MRDRLGLRFRSPRSALFALAVAGMLSACAYGSVGGEEEETEEGEGDVDAGPGAPTNPNSTGTGNRQVTLW